MLPAERESKGSKDKKAKEKDIEDQKDFIRKKVLGVKNNDLMNDKLAVELLEQLGGDLMINAFACNFKIDGKPNTDVVSSYSS